MLKLNFRSIFNSLAANTIFLALSNSFNICSLYFDTSSPNISSMFVSVAAITLNVSEPLFSTLAMANLFISFELITWVPAQSSTESPIVTTLTTLPYLSLNKAIAPFFLASSKLIYSIFVSYAACIFWFTKSSTFNISSSDSLPW